jgi:CBS domain-containing protein
MSTIRDVLGRKGASVITAGGNISVLEAIKIMSEANIGALVIQEKDRPLGIFTERDYLRKIVLKGRSHRHGNHDQGPLPASGHHGL